MVSITHEQSIICSQLFAGHVVGSRPMKKWVEMHRMITDVGGTGVCFFRVVSYQLYFEPNYHMNIRSVGVQYMRNNPERFIESNTDHSWLRYLAYM